MKLKITTIALIITFASAISQKRHSFEATIQYSTQNPNDGLLLTGASAILGVIAMSYSYQKLTESTKSRDKEKEEKLVKYMQSNHSVLKRDFSLATGAFFEEISYQLELDEREKNQLRDNLEGSDEQRKILKSLSGKITVEKARSFSENLTTLIRDSVEPYRYASLLQHASID